MNFYFELIDKLRIKENVFYDLAKEGNAFELAKVSFNILQAYISTLLIYASIRLHLSHYSMALFHQKMNLLTPQIN